MDRENELMHNLEKIHTTELGIERIGRNLTLNAEDIIGWCKERIQSPKATSIKKGKNWYVREGGYCITINADSYTIITAHREKNSG